MTLYLKVNCDTERGRMHCDRTMAAGGGVHTGVEMKDATR